MYGYLAIMVSRCLRELFSLGRDSIQPFKNNFEKNYRGNSFHENVPEVYFDQFMLNCLKEGHHCANYRAFTLRFIYTSVPNTALLALYIRSIYGMQAPVICEIYTLSKSI